MITMAMVKITLFELIICAYRELTEDGGGGDIFIYCTTFVKYTYINTFIMFNFDYSKRIETIYSSTIYFGT